MKRILPINGSFIYSSLLEVEKNFSPEEYVLWLSKNWSLSIYLAGIYVISAISLEKFMKGKPRLELQPLLILWNLGLAVFSMFGTLRMLPDMLYMAFNFGLEYTICTPELTYNLLVVNYWVWLFDLSKIVELGDTLFLVVRKQPLTFLHCFHHALTFIGTWLCCSQGQGFQIGRWMIAMNYLVHSFMYSYFTLKAMHLPVPLVISKSITISQIIQMVLGMSLPLYEYFVVKAKHFCNYENNEFLLFTFAMYWVYFILFVHFYYKRYLLRRSTDPIKKKVL